MFPFVRSIAALVAALGLLMSAHGLKIPHKAFSLHDLKGADTRPVTDMYVFGDSYSDNCNAVRYELDPKYTGLYPFPSCPPPPIGRADNAIAWPEAVNRFRPDWNVTIYAVSAATCDNSKQNQGSRDLAGQISDFTTYGNIQGTTSGLKTDPNTSIAAVMIGINDIQLIQLKQWGQLPPTSNSTGNLNDSSSCVANSLDSLHKLGFRRFALFEVPPIDTTEKLGDSPAHAASTKQAVATLNSLNAQAATQLTKQWKDGSTISVFPSVKLFTPMAELESSYGFKHGAGTYCDTICPRPFQYLFVDNLHYSYRAFYLLANAVVRWLDPKWRHGPIFSEIDGSGAF